MGERDIIIISCRKKFIAKDSESGMKAWGCTVAEATEKLLRRLNSQRMMNVL